MPEALKLQIAVQAGVVLGEPMAEYTRVWQWTNKDQAEIESDDEETRREANRRYVDMMGASREYAATLEEPHSVNWVTRTWMWM